MLAARAFAVVFVTDDNPAAAFGLVIAGNVADVFDFAVERVLALPISVWNALVAPRNMLSLMRSR